MQGAKRYHLDLDVSNENTSHTRLLLGTGHDKRVLEVGPATGYVTEALQERGCQVTCIEIDPTAAEQARPFAKRMIVGNIEELDLVAELHDERFDVIMFGDVLEHMVNPDMVLDRVRSFLAPGGCVLASIPNVAHGALRLALLGGVFRYTDLGLLDRTHLRFFTRQGVEAMFRRTMYTVDTWERVTVDIFATEQQLKESDYPAALIEALRRDPEAETYQFVVTARPLPSGSAGFGSNNGSKADEVGSATHEVFQALLVGEKAQQALAEARVTMARRETELQAVRDRLAAREGQFGEVEVRLANAEQQLIAIHGSLGYRLLKGYRRAVHALFPPDSIRGIPYRLFTGVVRGALKSARRAMGFLRRGFSARRRYGAKGALSRSLGQVFGSSALDPVKLALSVNWRARSGQTALPPRPDGPPTVNWVVPHISEGGGLRTIFRFVDYLHRQGFRQRLYEMPVGGPARSSPAELRSAIQRLFRLTVEEVSSDFENMEPADFTFATSWHTAYPVIKQANARHKMYFVQDFEPHFAAVGTESVLAENTYRFGMQGLTAGRWLRDKLSEDYGMSCEYFDLSVDPLTYYPKAARFRNKIFYYARPATPRRGFELGMKALEIFHERHPEFEITLAGGDIHRNDWTFPVKDRGYLNEAALNDLYNESAAALVISLTNCSLLPLEIMAAGCPVVTNAGPNNEKLLPADSAILAISSPHHLADALEKAIEITDRDRVVEAAVQHTWDEQFRKVETFLRELLEAEQKSQ